MLFCATYADYSGFGRSAKSVLGWHATEEVGGENGLRREHPAMRSILMPKSSMIGLWTKPVVYDRVVSKVLSKTYIALRAGIVTDEFLVNSVAEGVKMMAIAYSQDLRVRALKLIKTGVSITQVSCLLSISRPTLYRWLEQLEATGSTAPKPRVPPQVQVGQVIIMDNAPFHNSKKIRELIENAGCELLFLPSYSPDLNPIEHWWHKVKTAIRKELPKFEFNIHKAADAAFQYL